MPPCGRPKKSGRESKRPFPLYAARAGNAVASSQSAPTTNSSQGESVSQGSNHELRARESRMRDVLATGVSASSRKRSISSSGAGRQMSPEIDQEITMHTQMAVPGQRFVETVESRKPPPTTTAVSQHLPTDPAQCTPVTISGECNPATDPLADTVYERAHSRRATFDYKEDDRIYREEAKDAPSYELMLAKVRFKIHLAKHHPKGATVGTLSWYERFEQRLVALQKGTSGRLQRQGVLYSGTTSRLRPRPDSAAVGGSGKDATENEDTIMEDGDEMEEEDETDEDETEGDDSDDEDYTE